MFNKILDIYVMHELDIIKGSYESQTQKGMTKSIRKNENSRI